MSTPFGQHTLPRKAFDLRDLRPKKAAAVAPPSKETTYICARCNGECAEGQRICDKPECSPNPRSLDPGEVDSARAAAIAEITARLERSPRWAR